MKARALLLGVLLLGGCASQKSWVYAPDTHGPPGGQPARAGKSIVVLPFEDMRENVNSNKTMLYLIPLMPFGWADLNVPEGQQMHMTSGLWTNYKPTEDFAKALAAELEGAGLFRNAHFGFNRAEGDLVATGRILNTKYKGRIFSYGLSAYGPLLWLLGLPAATVRNDLSVELRVEDAVSGERIFSRPYDVPAYSRTTWIYSLANDFAYADLLKEVYRQFVKDLQAARIEGGR